MKFFGLISISISNFSVQLATNGLFNTFVDNKDEYLHWNCPGVSKDAPLASPFSCQNKFSLQRNFNFKHNDTCANLSIYIYQLFIHPCLYGMVSRVFKG